MEEKRARFQLVLSNTDRRLLDAMARDDSCSKGALIRRLIRKEAKIRGIALGMSWYVEDGWADNGEIMVAIPPA